MHPSDIVYLGALVNYILNSPRWNSEPFLREYVVKFIPTQQL
jgi:formate dehydrogenase major subunit